MKHVIKEWLLVVTLAEADLFLPGPWSEIGMDGVWRAVIDSILSNPK